MLLNFMLHSRPMEHTDATKTLSTAERIRPVTKLLAGILEKIGEALGGPMLFMMCVRTVQRHFYFQEYFYFYEHFILSLL